MSTISGGISNALYKVTPSTSTALNPVAFRIYGANTEKFIDREKEVAAMAALHAHGFGPALLGFFPNGRIESFLPMRCLNPDEMAAATFVPGIAATLAKFHAFNAAEAPATPATPFGRIYEWLDVVSGLDFSDNAAKAEAFAAFDLKQMREEVVAVEKAAAMAQSPVVFAHNDLLSGNIMVALSNTPQNGNNGARNPAEGDESAVAAPSGAAQAPDCSREAEDGACAADMTFIDFEYADWAPRGFDWGNHFCEYAGFECDYTRYPGPEAAGRFVRAYLAAAGGVTPDNVVRHIAPNTTSARVLLIASFILGFNAISSYAMVSFNQQCTFPNHHALLHPLHT